MAMTLTSDDINALKGIFATKADLKNELSEFANKYDLANMATKEDLNNEINGVIEVVKDVMVLVNDRFDKVESKIVRIEKHLSRKYYFPQLKLSAD